MTVQLSYRVLWVYATFIAFNFNEEMNSFKGMGVLNVITDKKSSRVSSSKVHDSPGSFAHTWSQQRMAELPRRQLHSFPALFLSLHQPLLCASASTCAASGWTGPGKWHWLRLNQKKIIKANNACASRKEDAIHDEQEWVAWGEKQDAFFRGHAGLNSYLNCSSIKPSL